MAFPKLSLDVATQMVDVLNECYAEGFAVVGNSKKRAAMIEAAQRLDLSRATLASRLDAAQRLYGLKPDPDQYRSKSKPLFTVDPLPHDGEPSAEDLIEQLTRRHRDRATHHDPVRYVRTFFSLEEMSEYLTWRREKWSLGKTHA